MSEAWAFYKSFRSCIDLKLRNRLCFRRALFLSYGCFRNLVRRLGSAKWTAGCAAITSKQRAAAIARRCCDCCDCCVGELSALWPVTAQVGPSSPTPLGRASNYLLPTFVPRRQHLVLPHNDLGKPLSFEGFGILGGCARSIPNPILKRKK